MIVCTQSIYDVSDVEKVYNMMSSTFEVSTESPQAPNIGLAQVLVYPDTLISIN